MEPKVSVTQIMSGSEKLESVCSSLSLFRRSFALSERIERVGLGDITYLTFASGGAFTQFSHEFQTITDAGEDVVYLDREKNIAINEEVYTDEVINQLGVDKAKLEKVKTAEVGNIFSFGDTKSKQLDLNYINEAGESVPVILGSYGIGITRLVGVIVEHFSDEKGIMWPENVAPFKVHLVGLNQEDESIKSKANKVYEELTNAGIEVIFDDRVETQAGEKFSDADLIGIPWRVVVSKKSGDQVELKKRDSKESQLMSVEELISKVK